MGQQLLKNFSVDKDVYMTGGFNNLWNIHKGYSKLKEGDLASIFVFEKRKLEKFKEKEKEEILVILRKEANFLLKFKHPGILGISESLQEDKNTIQFATEYCPYTLSTLLNSGNLTVLEMKMLMIELIDVLIFLHEDAKVIHSYIHPDGVLIDEKGRLKLSCFNFAIQDPSEAVSVPLYNFNNVESPNLNFISPEGVIDKKITYKTDIFSFGVLVCYLIKKIRKLPISLTNSTLDTYQKNLSYGNFNEKFLQQMIKSLEQNEIQLLNSMLTFNYDNRIAAKNLKEQSWFNDHIILALKFIENIETNDQNKNSVFFQQFPNLINKFEEKIIVKKILPKFIELLRLENFINQVLPAIFCITEKCESINFEEKIWPNIKALFKLKSMSAASLYFLINKIDYISTKISNSEFTNHMLNIICKSLDTNMEKLQKAVFEKTAVINKIIDSQAFKNQIYERMISIVVSTQFQTIKMIILNQLKDTYKLLDQTTLNNTFLGTMEKLRKTDSNKTDVCMKIVEIYEEIAKVVSIEVYFLFSQ